MRSYQRLFILALSLMVFHHAQASHFSGANMYYECLTPSMYRLHHNTYYDCTSSFPGLGVPPPPAGITLNTLGSSCTPPTNPGGWILTSVVDIVPVCPGVSTGCTAPSAPFNGTMEIMQYTDYDFSATGSCTQISIDWASCCRNTAITSGLANGGVFQRVNINLGLSPCNSSPVILMTPRPYICAGVPTRLTLNAFDIDGDSLKYSLVACQTAAGVSGSYSSGYSPSSPLGPTWQVQLDSVTGELFINPNQGSPTVGPLCVQIEEFRNGVSLGVVGFEVQLVVTTCAGSTSNSPPSIDQLQVIKGGTVSSNWEITLCQSDTLVFQVSSSDADPSQSLAPEISTRFPGLSVSFNAGNPMLAEYVLITNRTEDFYIPIIVWDDHCPMRGNSLQHILVRVGNNCLQAQTTAANCGSPLGAIDLSLWGGTAPFRYLWSTGDTTEDIYNLIPGTYSVQVMDFNNRVFVDSFIVNALNISLNPTLTLPNCADQQGMIHTTVTGATPPYSYLWNTGATSDSLANLSSGGYSLTITDSLGCPRHEAFLLIRPDSCFNFIEGKMYEDINGNCQFDGADVPLINRLVDIQPGGAMMTDVNGNYSFRVDTGKFVVEALRRQYQQALCPVGGKDSVTFVGLANVASNVDFALQTDSVKDFRVSYYQNRARPGFNPVHTLIVYNDGSYPANGLLTWTHDTVFQYTSAIPTPISYNVLTHTATWNINQLAPYGRTARFAIRTYVPATTALNVPFSNRAQIDPILGDSTPANNISDFTSFTRGAYDPNDKQVSPQGQGTSGFIEQNEKTLNYTIRFQNTGNDTAFYVVLRDTLDTDLQALSFQHEVGSHPYRLRIEDDRILVFTFANILLPDSTTNLAGSQGFVKFSLQLKDSLPLGTQIRNQAAIYFDFNPPIFTNEVVNTLSAFPEISLGQDSVLCEGEMLIAEVIQSGVPPYTFQWSNGVIDMNNHMGISSIQPVASGIYQVRVTDSLGVYDLQEIEIRVFPVPDAAFSYQPNGLSFSFNGSSTTNTDWFWDFGDGATVSGQQNTMHIYAASGTYQVSLIAQTDCGADTVTQMVNVRGLGMGENDFFFETKIIPHPVQDISYLHFPNPAMDLYHLRINDLQGKLIRTYPGERTTSFQIEKGSLNSGLYIFELSGKNTYFCKMVIK